MNRSGKQAPAVRTATALAVLLVSGLLTMMAPGPSAATHDDDGESSDITGLRAGAMPRLPYVDWTARRIVDGSRRVSISGIQGRVVSLFKVDGGYLLGRQLTTNPPPSLVTGDHDLVFVSTSGARRSILSHWASPRRGQLNIGAYVGQNGDKVLVNTRQGTTTSYLDTRVLSLPRGEVLRQRDFGVNAPLLMGLGVDRALLQVGSNVAWWNPSSDSLDTVLANASGESADLDAWQFAVRPQADTYRVRGIPPAVSPNWTIEQEDVRFGPWSPNGAYVAGNNEVTDGHEEASSYQAHRTSDGRVIWGLGGSQDPQMTWESNSALLLRTRIPHTMRYQLIRCYLSASCYRVGPSTSDRRGVIIPAFRRNS